MKKAWIIALQSVRVLLKNKTVFIWVLGVPCIYILIFGSAFKGGQDPSQTRAYLAVRNQDGGFLSERFVRLLRSENLNAEVFGDSMPQNAPRRLTIPRSFTSHLLSGKRDTLEYLKRSESNVDADMSAELAVRRAAYRLIADLAELQVKDRPLNAQAFSALDSLEPLIQVHASYAGARRMVPHGFQQQVPANIVQFVLLFLFIYAGGMVFEEKQTGLLKRIRTAPVSYASLFAGKLMGCVLAGLFQSALILIVGRFVFGVHIGNAPAALFLVILLYLAAVGSLGLCIGFWVRNADKLLAVSILSALVMAALSGCWWPLEITPPWAQHIALLLPSGLALKSLHALISFGQGFGTIWPYLLALAGYSVGLILLYGFMLHRRSSLD